MNLKQAAQRLAVHYQTVYRWVRDGELSAVKVGNRYEVSDAAIDQFLSRRASLSTVPIQQPQSEASQTAAETDELGALRILAHQTRTTAQPCFDAATALAGSRVGETAVLRLLDDAGERLRAVSSFAVAPADRAAVVGAVEAAGSFDRDTVHWSAAERSGDVHVVHHMPQDVVRDLFGDEARFIGHGVHVLAAAVAPIFDAGVYLGGLMAVRTASYSPFTDDEIALLREAAEFCGEAQHRATRFVRAYEANSLLRDRASAALADGMDADDLTARGSQLLVGGRAQALVSPDGFVLCSNSLFSLATGMNCGERFGPNTFAGRWKYAGVSEVVDGTSSRAELDPIAPGDHGAIVSAVRGNGAAVGLLAVDIIDL